MDIPLLPINRNDIRHKILCALKKKADKATSSGLSVEDENPENWYSTFDEIVKELKKPSIEIQYQLDYLVARRQIHKLQTDEPQNLYYLTSDGFLWLNQKGYKTLSYNSSFESITRIIAISSFLITIFMFISNCNDSNNNEERLSKIETKLKEIEQRDKESISKHLIPKP